MRKVLNVGGNSKRIPLPEHYKGWEHVLLDIDPKGKPDIVCDARNLNSLEGNQFDAIYCSHNLEHYYSHDVLKVLSGFRHVLKPEGFAEIRVPDIGELMRIVVSKKLDIEDFLYQSPLGPIKVKDVLYGHAGQIEQSGEEFYAHKTGFTLDSLQKIMRQSGFPIVYIATGKLEVRGIGFKDTPSFEAKTLLGLMEVPAA